MEYSGDPEVTSPEFTVPTTPTISVAFPPSSAPLRVGVLRSSPTPASTSISGTSNTPATLRGTRRPVNQANSILSKISEQLDVQQRNLDRFDYMAQAWAGIIRSIPRQQQIIAEKLINDIMFEAQLENLSKESCLQVNQLLVQMQHHPQPSHFYIQHPQPSLIIRICNIQSPSN